MAQYFTAYRIDHILGFCRIWEIPGDCTTGERDLDLDAVKVCFRSEERKLQNI